MNYDILKEGGVKMAISVLGEGHRTTSCLSTMPKFNSEVLGDEKKKYDNIMSEAIEAYKDEMLTGLTEEERAAINALVKAYMEKHPIKTKADKEALVQYIKGLLKDYGYKGDYDACALALGMGAIKEKEEEIGEAQTAYAKENRTMLATLEKVQSSFTPSLLEGEDKDEVEGDNAPKKSTDSKEGEETISKIVINPDGSKTLVMIRDSVIVSKVKIDNGSLDRGDEVNHLVEQMNRMEAFME